MSLGLSGWVDDGGGVNVRLVMAPPMESETKELLGWRMGGVVLSDLLWFVQLRWLKVVKLEVTGVGCFVLIVS